eukprot:215874_1
MISLHSHLAFFRNTILELNPFNVMTEICWNVINELENLGWTHQECIAASYQTEHCGDLYNKMLNTLQDNCHIDKKTGFETDYASHTDLLVFGYLHSNYETEHDTFIPLAVKALCCNFYGYPLCCIAFTNPENGSQTSNEFNADDIDHFYDKNNLVYTVRKHPQDINMAEALFISIVADHKTCFSYLIHKTKNPSLCGKCPLFVTSRMGNVQFVQRLLQMDCIDILKRTTGALRQTALFVAAFYGHYQIVKLLIEAEMEKFNIQQPSEFLVDKHNDTEEYFPLFVACQNGHAKVSELILAHNADVTQTDAKQRSALWISSLRGHVDVVELLLSQPNLGIDDQDVLGVTALWAACQNNHIKVVELLLKANANPDLGKSDGCTPCWIVANHGSVECLELLIQYGADINKPDAQSHGGATPLFVASQNGKKEAVLVLLIAGADSNPARKEDGTTPIMMAAHNGYIEIVRQLLNFGADIMQANAERFNVFGCAAMQGHCDIVKLLHQHLVDSNNVKYDAIVQFVDEGDTGNGWTALHVACMAGHLDVVEYMVDTIKVDIDKRDHQDRTAQMHACQNGHSLIRPFLDRSSFKLPKSVN